MAGLLQTLLRPDQEEPSDRSDVAQAANLLQIGEFQLLQLAYASWHGEEMPASMVDGLFERYMFKGEVPIWARHYARSIIEAAERDELDDSQPGFHRYDCDYYRTPPQGYRRFGLAVFWIVFAMAGSLALAQLAPETRATSVLPPFFESDDLESGHTND